MSLVRGLKQVRAYPSGRWPAWGAAPSHDFARERAAPHRLISQIRLGLEALRRTVRVWNRRRNDRAMLRSLGDRDIHDFCPRRTEAEAEMNKPFWRA